jgi:hypothetical protein
MGTDRHFLAECFFNGIPFRWWERDMEVLFDFCRKEMMPRGLVAFRTEMTIFHPLADLAGSIDLILKDGEGTFHIVDFKRSNKLKDQMRGYSKMSKPFSHLDDCKGASYALQLSLYQKVLEEVYGMKIGDRVLLSIHSEAPFYTSVPYLSDEAEFLLNNRKNLVSARVRVAEEDPSFLCSITKRPAFEAVVLKDNGRVAMERIAVVKGLPFSVDYGIRKRFEERVSSQIQPPPLFKGRKGWKSLMPNEGLPVFSGNQI